jgi:uncharacterized surface protein with fasciclin (FAS1) repeats
MSMRRLLPTLALVLALLLAIVLPMPAIAQKPGSQTIAEIAIGNPDFSTLVAALVCTDLVGAVAGKQKNTVFAPTNAAFAKLNLNADNVCTALDTATLSNILLYHITPGVRLSQSVLGKTKIVMRNGGSISVSDSGVINGNSTIVAADIRAKNGVIHVIDSVLLPQ